MPCSDQSELDRYWNAILEGGGNEQAYGWLIDVAPLETAYRS